MADLHIKPSGTWKAIDNCSVKVSGAWKQVETVYVKVSGAWKVVWNNLTINLSGTSGSPIGDTDIALTPASATAGWSFTSAGDLNRVSGSNYNPTPHEWTDPLTGGLGGSYWIRFTYQSGDVPTVGVLGSWLALTSTRQFYWQTSSGTLQGAIKVEIASDSGGSTIVATGYYDGYAESTP